MKKNSTIFLLAMTLSLPLVASAASPSVSVAKPVQAVAAGDTVLVPVMLDIPDPTGINAFSARITVSGPAHLVGVSTGGSVFTLWPEGPAVAGDSVVFVGGTPGSVYGSPLKAVTLVVSAVGAGKAEVSIAHATAYVADGKGTVQGLKDVDTFVMIGSRATSPRNEFAAFLAGDTTPPDPFAITLGRDSSLSGGSYFISFSANDSGSGVSRYEVIENGGPAVVATSTYVLSDQSLNGPVVVRAIDASGNVRTETIRFRSSGSPLWKPVMAGVGVIVAVLVVILLRRKRRTRQSLS